MGNLEETYSNRWRHAIKSAKKLKLQLFEAQSVWNNEIALNINTSMDDILNRLRIATDNLLMSRSKEYIDMADELFTRDQANILYANREQSRDNFRIEIDNLIKKIEKFAKPKLTL